MRKDRNFFTSVKYLDFCLVTVYSYRVGKKEKLLEKANRNPKGLRFSEFENLLSMCGWVFDHQTGSHRIWYSPDRVRLSIQPTKNNEAKSYQVKQFLATQEKENVP